MKKKWLRPSFRKRNQINTILIIIQKKEKTKKKYDINESFTFSKK